MLRRRPSSASEKEQVQKKKLTLQRSSSFKDFMKLKVTSPVTPAKEFVLDEAVEGDTDGGEIGSKLGKKWRNAISRTMTRKTSKMVQKFLAEEGALQGESSEQMSPMSPNWGSQRTSTCSTGSEDTVSSPVTCPFSGNSDRQSPDSGYCQRDSVRLDENVVSFNGPFCGRAVAHTDFTPSPYEVDSLKLQKGDIIHIIEKPPVGTWTGKLNHKIIIIGQKELTSLLSMHGFQTLEDFTDLRESHLNELNITDPDQRAEILSAVDLLRDSEDESSPQQEGEEVEDRSEEDAKEPRDSGCFESAEHLDVRPEEAKPDKEFHDEETEQEEKMADVQQHLQQLNVQDAC
ncbi:SAM and SH3 domain-containing protein 3 isoform X2 [Phycodurus eques]|uniref:SAM and SH3 domain-containing protein 3 isoform X2 n=1 Tax=Phycodurus eques TaxID=693459 RepID=UPI002ACDE49D|nr:SAM and SH3 domain-containing protein 3 isoform X2 [Phycodurus eques]